MRDTTRLEMVARLQVSLEEFRITMQAVPPDPNFPIDDETIYAIGRTTGLVLRAMGLADPEARQPLLNKLRTENGMGPVDYTYKHLKP